MQLKEHVESITRNNPDIMVDYFLFIESSTVKSFAYIEELRMLVIEFPKDKFYFYKDVNRSKFEGLYSSASKGEYFNNYIRNYHDYGLLS